MFKEYREEVLRVYREASQHHDEIHEKQKKLLYAGIGLAGEVGEVLNLIKKDLFHGKVLNREHLKDELGDVLWYLTFLCEISNFTFQEIMDMNLQKMQERFPPKEK